MKVEVLTLLVVILSLITVIHSAKLQLTGANEAGAEFGPGSNNYQWPVASSYTHLKSIGMNVFRVPFLWERLQPSIGGSFDSTYQSSLVSTINGITGVGAYALIDPHNYARYNNQIIGIQNSIFFKSFF